VQDSSESAEGNLRLRNAVVQRVTVVRFGVDNEGSDGAGCVGIKASTDATKFMDMRVAEFRK